MYNCIYLLLLIYPWIVDTTSPPSTGLYFRLGSTIYMPGKILNIHSIKKQPRQRADPGLTLVCVTSNINRQCCRRSDGGNIGEWYYPNGTLVTRPVNPYLSHSFFRIGHAQQIRLARAPDGVERPDGTYRCEVSDENGHIVSASIKLIAKLPAPLLVSVFPPLQPVYATSTRNMSFHIQLQHRVTFSAYFKIQWTSPVISTQHFQIMKVNATGLRSYEGSISLSNLKIVDSGNYTCSVSLHSSSNQYPPEKSDVTEGISCLVVEDVPTIEVTILSTSEPLLGRPYILLCSHRSVEPNFIYSSSFEWCHNGVVLIGEKSQVLTIFSLSYSRAGNYTCKVKATSSVLTSSLSGSSLPHQLILQAPSPTFTHLMLTPNLVFLGTSAQLTCSAIYTGRVDVNLMVTMEFRGPIGAVKKQAMMNSLTNFTSTYYITNTRDHHAGQYNCSIVSSGPSLTSSPSTTSNSINVTIVGPPSSLRVIAKVPFSTSIHFSWDVLQDDIIEYFELYYSYEIKECHGLGSIGRTNITKIARSYNLTRLEENSEVTITLTAINTAGRSPPATFTIDTLQTAPTRGPANVQVTSVTSGSISTSWDPVPCSHRNTNVTGYSLIYFALNSEYHQNISINQQSYNATRLIPATRYRIDIAPNHNVHGQVAATSSIEASTATIRDLTFFLNGSLLSNNSIVKPNAVGIEGYGLFCLTNLANCCRPPFSSITKGHWIFPNHSVVPSQSAGVFSFSRTRHSSSVILHHRTEFLTGPTGVFTCIIPDMADYNQKLYIHISDDHPELIIKEFTYNRQNTQLTCISKGRPVDSYQWFRDGRVIDQHNSNFHRAQILTDGSSATYENYLYSENKTNFEGRFTCVVIDIYGNSDSKTLMLNNCPAGQYGTVAFDGSTVCIACPSNSMSTSQGSNKCDCLPGYYRNDLEDQNFPCTRPPTKCRYLRVKELSDDSVVLHWTRPVISGRDDLHYNVYLSDPDHPGDFLKNNLDPFANDDSNVQYTLSGLQPHTTYKARVFPYNGVSGKVESDDNKRMCEVSWTTSSEILGVPRSVSAVCGMVGWQVPLITNERTLTGYDIIFTSTTTNNTVLVSKNSDELFHVIREKDWPDKDQNYQASIMVRAKTATSNGAWSKVNVLDCPSVCTSS